MMYTLKKKIIIAVILVLFIGLFIIWQNNHIGISEIEVNNSKIPKSFNGYRIVHLSDLHNKDFGSNENKLIVKTKNAEPDIIVITGDLIDSRNTNIEVAIEFIKEAVKIAPIYYVSGNHEARSDVYDELSEKLKESGVTILDNELVEIVEDGSIIKLSGMIDPSFGNGSFLDKRTGIDTSKFNILLSHRPELINMYADKDIDLAFTGHAHGGQIRLPFIGGLVAPDQGLLPKYTSGLYTLKDTSMIVSRGLGNSIFPIRVFNRPEIIVVTLNN